MSLRPLDLELAHVRDCEDAGVRAHARCSGMTPSYCTGISQPAKERDARRVRRGARGAGFGAASARRAGCYRRGFGGPSATRGEGGHFELFVRHLEALAFALAVSGALGVGSSSGTVVRRRRRCACGPKPVAITVTRTSSFSASSMTAPKITLAFWSTQRW